MGLEKMGKNVPQTKRQLNDYYASNPFDVEQIIDILHIDKMSSILEPCAGEGHIAKTLNKLGYINVKTNDLIKRGYELDFNIDYLNFKLPIKRFDYIITNPPFKYAKDFIERSLEYADKVIILAKLDLLESNKRKDLNNKYLSNVYVHSNRAKFALNGEEKYFNKSSSMSSAWFVYDINKKGKTQLEVI